MSSLHPRVPKDLALAPVAAEIDLNLQFLRDHAPEQIEYELDVTLDRPAAGDSRDERAARVREAALRNVDMHHWQAEITDDAARLRLSGGSVSVDLGLSAALMRYIEGTDTTSR
jgi:hypothetical protein